MNLRFIPWSLGLAFILPALWAATAAAQPAAARKVEPSRETTFVVQPKRPDGFVDLAAAVNKYHQRGVTADNNGAIPYLSALGPAPPGGQPLSSAFYSQLGMTPPPMAGEYFVGLLPHLKKAGIDVTRPVGDRFHDQLDRAMNQPWAATEMPELSQWLDANQAPLAQFADAAKRPRFFMPLVIQPEDFQDVGDPRELGQAQGLLLVLQPQVQASREVARALAARAMLRTGQGDAAGAWNDLLAIHRLGRLLSQGPTAVETLVGVAVASVAEAATLGMIQHSAPNAATVRRYLADLQQLPPLFSAAEKFHVYGRIEYVDMALLVAQGGSTAETILSLAVADGVSELCKLTSKPQFATADWNAALRAGHKWFDKYVEALRKPNYQDRAAAIAAWEREVDAFLAHSRSALFQQINGQQLSAQEAGEYMGQSLAILLIRQSAGLQMAEHRAEQLQRNLRIALALAAYRAEQGAYPQQLAELGPKYLSMVPDDLFAAGPLRYERTATGYRLSSDGPDGHASDDDLVIEMPAGTTR